MLISNGAFAQKVQIKAPPRIQPKINIPKVNKVHVNSNSIIVPGSSKTDKKKETTIEPQVKDKIEDKEKTKKKK